MSNQKLSWWIGMCLLDGPSTLEEIKAAIQKSPSVSSLRKGYYRIEPKNRHSLINVSDDLAELIQAGWVIQDDNRYTLTTRGRSEENRVAENPRISIEGETL